MTLAWPLYPQIGRLLRKCLLKIILQTFIKTAQTAWLENVKLTTLKLLNMQPLILFQKAFFRFHTDWCPDSPWGPPVFKACLFRHFRPHPLNPTALPMAPRPAKTLYPHPRQESWPRFPGSTPWWLQDYKISSRTGISCQQINTMGGNAYTCAIHTCR